MFKENFYENKTILLTEFTPEVQVADHGEAIKGNSHPYVNPLLYEHLVIMLSFRSGYRKGSDIMEKYVEVWAYDLENRTCKNLIENI